MGLLNENIDILLKWYALLSETLLSHFNFGLMLHFMLSLPLIGYLCLFYTVFLHLRNYFIGLLITTFFEFLVVNAFLICLLEFRISLRLARLDMSFFAMYLPITAIVVWILKLVVSL